MFSVRSKASITSVEKLLTNRRGKITSSNILKLLVVFSVAVWFQCFTLLLAKDYILQNGVSPTKFLSVSFIVTCVISMVQQKTYKYLSYVNAKRLPLIAILTQSVLYSFSFLCLIYGLITNDILQYYSLIGVIQILNIKHVSLNSSHGSLVFWWMGLLCFVVGIALLFAYEYHLFVGLIALVLYHLLSYLREVHYSLSKHNQSLQRMECLSFLFAALFTVLLSFLCTHLPPHLPRHNHSFDLQQKFLSDEKAFMHHSITHNSEPNRMRMLLNYKEKMQELEQLLIVTPDTESHYSLSQSTSIYILFALFFVLLNKHLSYLQIKIYEFTFAAPKLDNILSHSHSNNSEEIADILKLKTGNSNLNLNISNSSSAPPLWAKLIFLYQFVSVQYIGIVSYSMYQICLIGLKRMSLTHYLPAILMFIGSECFLRSLMELQISYYPSVTVNIQMCGNCSRQWCTLIPSFVQHLRDNHASRKIFIFLSLNFLFMFVEFVYGYLSNSLGLISDACHMLFDCIALVIGLCASYLGSKHANINSNIKYSYGYGKMKVLSGFINAIFLIYIGLSVLIESLERIMHPPHIHTDQLLIVSVLGLFVNLIGLFFFHDAHVQSHSGCDHSHDHNLHGIFLHILADTLGSVGVIISSLLIYFFDLVVFDALCSVFIAILIFMTVSPLISSTSKILLQETPPHILSLVSSDLSNVLANVSGVIGYREPHFWEYEPGKLCGTIHVQIENDSNEQQILSQLSDIFQQRCGLQSEKDLTIQIEKEAYLDKVDPVHHSVYSKIIPVKAGTINNHSHHSHHCNHNHQ